MGDVKDAGDLIACGDERAEGERGRGRGEMGVEGKRIEAGGRRGRGRGAQETSVDGTESGGR